MLDSSQALFHQQIANAFIMAPPCVNKSDGILFHYHPQVTYNLYLVPKFYDLSQNLHTTFTLFVSLFVHG